MTKPALRRTGHRRPSTPKPAPSRHRWFTIHTTGPQGRHDAAVLPARWVAVGAAALVSVALLAIVLGPHRVGDYATETDFYEYARGATLIQQGRLEPARYVVIGPVYEITLALCGWVTRDLFLAGELISVVSAAGTLLLWFRLLARQVDPALGLWTILFLAANPTFFRYGYSVTTDSLATFVQAASLFALIAWNGGRAPFFAGILAAIAVLTRYNAIYLLPGAILIYTWRARPPRASDEPGRRRMAGWPAILRYAAGFALLTVPWLILALASDHPPGQALFHNIAYDIYARPHGITWDEYQIRLEPQFHSIGDVLRRDPPAFIRRELQNLVEHGALDMEKVLGWPMAAGAAIGLVLSLANRTWRRLLPLWVMGALLFATLVPAFHSERYSLPLAPIYLTLVGEAAASPRFAFLVGSFPFSLKSMGAIGLLAASVMGSAAYQSEILRDLPIEIFSAAETLGRVASPEARILTRKAHIAFHSGLSMVPFPAVRTLEELADFCRLENVEFIYYSQPEADTRPEFTYLLDPGAAVPGLDVVHFVPGEPGVAYRIAPGFGSDPEWLMSDSLRTVHVSRALNSIQAPEWRQHLISGIYGFERGQLTEALAHFTRLTRTRPDLVQGWLLSGDIYRYLGDPLSALGAYSRALALDPNHLAARIGRGWAELESGRRDEAARTWRSAISGVDDSTTLRTMVELYRGLGDVGALGAAEQSLSRIRGQGSSP